jgi:hypothetical protein
MFSSRNKKYIQTVLEFTQYDPVNLVNPKTIRTTSKNIIWLKQIQDIFLKKKNKAATHRKQIEINYGAQSLINSMLNDEIKKITQTITRVNSD